ncbi:PCRF domain-containing protein, partial [Tropheryma whipplei]
MFETIDTLLREHSIIEDRLSRCDASPSEMKDLSLRYSKLSRVKAAYEEFQKISLDLSAARELADDDPGFLVEIPVLTEKLSDAQARLQSLLTRRDENDHRDVIMEIKGGEGGAESALFAADLLRMYAYFADSNGWKVEILSYSENTLGGYKDVQLAIRKTPSSTHGVWELLKYEGGVHRVQRVPATESQGRIHTSTTGVLVFPEVDAPGEIEITNDEIRIDVFRSS